jgi:hypothetical protein
MKVMGIYENFDEMDTEAPTTEKQFQAGANEKEGISGCLYIDTRYGNREAVMEEVTQPRSAKRGK